MLPLDTKCFMLPLDTANLVSLMNPSATRAARADHSSRAAWPLTLDGHICEKEKVVLSNVSKMSTMPNASTERLNWHGNHDGNDVGTVCSMVAVLHPILTCLLL